MHYSVVTF